MVHGCMCMYGNVYVCIWCMCVCVYVCMCVCLCVVHVCMHNLCIVYWMYVYVWCMGMCLCMVNWCMSMYSSCVYAHGRSMPYARTQVLPHRFDNLKKFFFTFFVVLFKIVFVKSRL